MARSRKYPNEQFNGLLLIDKPQGWTSNDVVQVIRGKFKQNKVGHAGTLDPMATGLLILLINAATKLSDKLFADTKVYEGEVSLGAETNTQDAEGEIIKEVDMQNVSIEEILTIKKDFLGDILQIPPMVSALKRDGQTLYNLARKGIIIERDPRPINISQMEFSNFKQNNQKFDILVECSKGTYIRTIAHDIGKKLNGVAHLSALRRTKIGEYDIRNAFQLEEVRNFPFEKLSELLTPIEL